jgi:hypothetical protein
VSKSSPQGIVEIPIGTVLNGPYTVLVDENTITNYRLSNDNATGSNSRMLAYPSGTHQVTIIETTVVPEFGSIYVILLALSISGIVEIMSSLGR